MDMHRAGPIGPEAHVPNLLDIPAQRLKPRISYERGALPFDYLADFLVVVLRRMYRAILRLNPESDFLPAGCRL